MYDVHPVLLSSIEERCLSVYIVFLQTESLLKQQVQTFFLAVPADVEEHGLLVTVLEVRVGPMVDQQLHDFIGLLVIDEDSREVKCGLPGLRLQSVDQNGLVLSQKPLDLVESTEYTMLYRQLMAMANSSTAS